MCLLRLSCQGGGLVALLVLVGDGGQGLAGDGVLGGLLALLAGVSLLTLLQKSKAHYGIRERKIRPVH
jgi:hypothetical protein